MSSFLNILFSVLFVNALTARTGEPESVLELLELVVGAAVMCENKTTFIHNIFGLNHNSQTVLKGLLEHAMQSMVDYDGEGTADFDRLDRKSVV